MKAIIINIVLGLIMLVGYGMNIVKIFGTDFEPPYKAEVIRVVGIFVPPVGVIVGFVTIED